MIKYEIIDNFINVSDFEQLEDYIMPHGHTKRPINAQVKLNNVPWNFHLNESVEGEELEHLKEVTDIEKLETINDKLFQHMFFWCNFQSGHIQVLTSLLGTIDPLAFYRIVANLTLQQKENRRSLFHIDADKERKPKSTMTTSIFYMNSTNGPTILEDGTEIECRANRLVTFPYETQHAAVLCTDQPYRIVINLNYFE